MANHPALLLFHAALVPIIFQSLLLLLLLLLPSLIFVDVEGAAAAGSWCIARSGASQTSLQAALDYACGSGADCGPIQPSGLCYLPNTLQAHASYAFNSYYQRSNYAPGSCDFGATATLTITDPSYGSCTFPSSPSSAGGVLSPPGATTPVTNPPTMPTTPTNGSPTIFPTNGTVFGGGFGGGGGISPGLGPGTTDISGTSAYSLHRLSLLFLLPSAMACWCLWLFV